jgi:hypothetical protein
MNAKPQSSYTKAPLEIHALGDSHTRNMGYDMSATMFYPTRLAALLETATGRPWIARNYGIAGDTSRETATGGTWTTASPGMIDRIDCIAGRTRVPDLAVIYCSSNNWSAMTLGGSFVDGGAVAAADVDEDVTLPDLQSMVDALIDAGIERVVVVGYHVLNWATGGHITAGAVDAEIDLDGANPGTYGLGSLWAASQAVDALAVTYPGKVAFCDLYAFFKTRLESATYSAQIGVDTFYHVGTGDSHLNSTGEQWVADAIAATVTAQGWNTALSAL